MHKVDFKTNQSCKQGSPWQQWLFILLAVLPVHNKSTDVDLMPPWHHAARASWRDGSSTAAVTGTLAWWCIIQGGGRSAATVITAIITWRRARTSGTVICSTGRTPWRGTTAWAWSHATTWSTIHNMALLTCYTYIQYITFSMMFAGVSFVSILTLPDEMKRH